MRKAFLHGTLAVLVCLLCTGCVSKYKKVRPTSFEVESVIPTGLKTFDIVVKVGIRNPAPPFTLMNPKATIRRDGNDFAFVDGENVAVDGKCEKVYRIPLKGRLADGVGVIQLLTLAQSFNPDDFRVDISARANVAGNLGKDIVYKDVPLSKFMNKL